MIWIDHLVYTVIEKALKCLSLAQSKLTDVLFCLSQMATVISLSHANGEIWFAPPALTNEKLLIVYIKAKSL